MKTRPFSLTEASSAELQAAYVHCQAAYVHCQAAYVHCQAADTKTRYQAVRLYGLRYAVEQVKEICACSRRSLMRWCHAYQTQGLTALCDHRQGGNRAKLKPEQIEAVQKQLHRYKPAQLLGKEACVGEGLFWTIPDLARLLQRDYGVAYRSRTAYQTLLQKCDFSYQRPAKQYKSHSDFKVMEFEETLEKKW